jgi:hypothetical protein
MDTLGFRERDGCEWADYKAMGFNYECRLRQKNVWGVLDVLGAMDEFIARSQKNTVDHAVYYLAHFAEWDKSPNADLTKFICEIFVDSAFLIPNPNKMYVEKIFKDVD